MTKLFNAFYSCFDEETNESYELDMDFNDIDDLEKVVDDCEYKIEFFDSSNIQITMNDGVETVGYLTKFMAKFDELNYDVMLGIGNCEYDDYLEEDGNYYYAFKYLTEYNNLSAEDAIEKCDEVMIYQGSASDYVEDFTRDCNDDVPSFLENYIDWNSMAEDWKRDGELIEIEDDVWVTNANVI